jgi:hypothetical protein
MGDGVRCVHDRGSPILTASITSVFVEAAQRGHRTSRDAQVSTPPSSLGQAP